MSYKKFLITISKFFDRIGLRGLNRQIKNSGFRLLGRIFQPRAIIFSGDENIQNILIIKQHNQMGDMICSTPLFTALRKHFPNAYMTLVAGMDNFRIVMHHPDLNETIVYHKLNFLSAPGEFFRFYRKLHERKYDLAVVPATISVSVTSDLICRLSGARFRLGARRLNGVENPSGFLYNLPVDLDWRNQQRHQILRNLELLKGIGIEPQIISPSIGIPAPDAAMAKQFYQKHFSPTDKVIGFHPGAGKIANQWPAERFAQLADYLVEKYPVKILITSGPSDALPVQKMIESMKSPYILSEKHTLQEVAAIFKRMQFYVTNDTGTLHVALAVGIPVVALFGPTNFWEWGPLDNSHHSIQSPDGDITSISFESVQKVVDEIMTRLL
ncbi:glycosyltransferase family 9 protein [candidate division KSB1 bacterium]|nr:glycosyltransferase family 9 protein [candidate division KSB1 bacterium]